MVYTKSRPPSSQDSRVFPPVHYRRRGVPLICKKCGSTEEINPSSKLCYRCAMDKVIINMSCLLNKTGDEYLFYLHRTLAALKAKKGLLKEKSPKFRKALIKFHSDEIKRIMTSRQKARPINVHVVNKTLRGL